MNLNGKIQEIEFFDLGLSFKFAMKIKQLKLNIKTPSPTTLWNSYPADKNTENRLLVSRIFRARMAMPHTRSDCADKVDQ